MGYISDEQLEIIHSNLDTLNNQASEMRLYVSNLEKELAKVKAELEEERKVVDWYADKGNWFGGNVSVFKEEFLEIDDVDSTNSIRQDGKTAYKVGGKRARERQKAREVE